MKTNLITRDGYEALKKELDYLWREHRPEITQKVAWAASLGDRSENADYLQQEAAAPDRQTHPLSDQALRRVEDC